MALTEHAVESDRVPTPRSYRVLLPDGINPSDHGSLPLLLLLHGGGGSSEYLATVQPQIEAGWAAGTLPPLAVATPDAERSFYLDWADGSQRWESFLMEEFLPHLCATLPVAGTPQTTMISGVSMGGHGTCRIGLRYPQRFRAMAAMEPAVMPAMELGQVPAANIAFQSAQVIAERYGSPPDAYWAENNAARIATENVELIKASGIRIYLEVGDEDFLLLNEGTEYLHQVLLGIGVAHEYRLVLGANHVGRSLVPRFADCLGFLARALEDPLPDPALEAILELKAGSGLTPP